MWQEPQYGQGKEKGTKLENGWEKKQES